MKVRLLLTTLLLFLISGLDGQINKYGVSDFVHYPPEITKGSEQNWAIVQDKRGVMYFGNDDKGILEYDGNEWRTIPIPNNSIVRSLACHDNGTVYVGAVSEFGYLAPDHSGNLRFKSLVPLVDSSNSAFTDVWKTYCSEDKVFFYSMANLFIYYPSKDTIRIVNNPPARLFTFLENDKLYSCPFFDGLFVLEGDTAFVPVKGGDHYARKEVYALTGYDEEHLLLCPSGSGLSLFNLKTGEANDNFAPAETNDLLSNNFITQLTRLADGRFAAATEDIGVLIINRKGEIVENISSFDYLQDYTIWNMYQPYGNYPYSHLWTAMHKGIGKINVESALHNFYTPDGYKGLITSIKAIDDILFISTTSGLYKYSVVNNKITFETIEDIQRAIWDLELFTPEPGQKVLLGIGDDGLVQINKDGTISDLNRKIETDEDEQARGYSGYCIYRDPKEQGKFYVGSGGALIGFHYQKGVWHLEFYKEALEDEVRSLARSEKGTLFFGLKLAGIRSISKFTDEAVIKTYGTEHGLPARENNYAFRIGPDVLVGTTDGIYKVYESADTTYFYKDSVFNKYLHQGTNAVLNIFQDPDGTIWISYNNSVLGWSILGLEESSEGVYKKITRQFMGLENFSTDAFFSSTGSDLWFSRSDKLYHFEKYKDFTERDYGVLIRKITLNDDSVIFNGTFSSTDQNGNSMIVRSQDPKMAPEIKYSENNVEFRWSAPFYEYEDKIEYSYYLDGFSDNWSKWERMTVMDFTNLPHGPYVFKVKARNVYLTESVEESFAFEIMRPWYLTYVAIISYIIGSVLLVYIIIVLYTRRLKNENIRLEGIIQERTAEIRKQKEELTDSIEYASRIQRALLPPTDMLKKQDLDHFILFKPRDIVSGDFYWFGARENKIFIVAADCTGHGVPGAFMSMLGISFLDEIVIKSGVSETNQILDHLRNHVITSLRQTGSDMEESTKDGMDLAMLAIDKEKGRIQFSGAYNPLYAARELTDEELKMIREGQELETDRGTIFNETHLLYQVKADPMPIGISEKKGMNFTASIVEENEATLYLFSDGFVDQFGGPKGKKFMSKNFKKLLLELQKFSMEEQKQWLDQTLTEWMGEISQIDDILVIGIRISK